MNFAVISISALIVFILIIGIVWLDKEHAKCEKPKLTNDIQKQLADQYHTQVIEATKTMREMREQMTKMVSLEQYKYREQELLDRNASTYVENVLLTDKINLVQAEFDKIQSGQISKSVRLGQIAESVAPLLAQFPYDYKKAVPMFRPIDYVVFEDTEVIFIEYKTGGAVLSEKQRNIRDNIQAGRVRFEVHRMDENGYTVKE